MRRLDRVPDRFPEKVPEKPAERTSLITKSRIRFRARTLHRWIDGVLISAHRRLSDAVNRDDGGGVIIADELRIFGADDTLGGDSQKAEYGGVNLASVLFFVPVIDGPPPPRDAFAVVKTRSERVKVGIGPFEIAGKFFLIEDAKLRDAIASPKPTFLALAAVTVSQIDGSGSTETFDAIVINRRAMDYIVPVESV